MLHGWSDGRRSKPVTEEQTVDDAFHFHLHSSKTAFQKVLVRVPHF